MYWYTGVGKELTVVHYDNDLVVLTVVDIMLIAIFQGQGVDLSLGYDRIDALTLVNK
jgi:hypothetical protein